MSERSDMAAARRSLRDWARERAERERRIAAKLAADPGCASCGAKPTKRSGGRPSCADCFDRCVS